MSSTSNVDTLSLLPCHLVGYFNNAKWIRQASQFERQARQLGVAQPRVTASAAAAVCGVSMAMGCPWPWTVHGRLLFPLWLCWLVPSFGPHGPPVTLAPAPRRTYSWEHLLTLSQGCS